MTTLGNILNTARSAITTYQAAIQVTSNNIANAGTEGYSRQRAVISATHPLHLPFASVGTGVEMTGVVRYRNSLLDAQFRQENGASSFYGLREQMVGQVEAILAEPTAAGLSSGLDAFFSAYSDLANDPTSSSARAALRENARALSARFNTMENGIRGVRDGLVRDLDGVIGQINDLTTQIADLNRQIVTAEASGVEAPNLRDARDRLVDRLSRHTEVRVIERSGGDLAVFVGGMPVVDGPVARALEVRSPAGITEIGLVGTPIVIATPGGGLGARLEVINTDVPAVLARLDSLASAFVTQINQLHQTGTNPLGQTAIDFFDPTGLTAATMSLSADVLAGTGAIAAGTPDLAGAYQAGANDVALSIASLRDALNPGLGMSFAAYHAETVTEVALSVASARENAAAHTTLRSRADTHRQSVSGVLTDEEMISLIEFQQAYTAATRLVVVADEMMQTILEMV